MSKNSEEGGGGTLTQLMFIIGCIGVAGLVFTALGFFG